jgi:hypothetical protein
LGVKGKPDTIDIIEQKRLQWHGHVKRTPEDAIPKLIMDWIPRERRKRGRPRKTWMEGVQADLTLMIMTIIVLNSSSVQRQNLTRFVGSKASQPM